MQSCPVRASHGAGESERLDRSCRRRPARVPLLRNCEAMYSAAISSPRDGVSLPSSKSDARNDTSARSAFGVMWAVTIRISGVMPADSTAALFPARPLALDRECCCGDAGTPRNNAAQRAARAGNRRANLGKGTIDCPGTRRPKLPESLPVSPRSISSGRPKTRPAR